MSEQELRDGLRVAVLDEPPLSFDPDALMERATRELARRRALVGAGVATTAVAVAAVAVPTLLGSPRGGGTGGRAGGPGVATELCARPSTLSGTPVPLSVLVSPSSGVPVTRLPASAGPIELGSFEPDVTFYSCPPSSSPTPSGPPPVSSEPPGKPTVSIDWPPPNVVPARYTAEQLTQRATEMREHMRVRFATVLPGAADVAPGAFGGEATGQVADGQGYLDGFVTYTLGGKRAAVAIYASGPGASETPMPAEECAHGTEPVCHVDHRSDGSWVVTKTEKLEGDGLIMSVTHYRANGSVVRATGYNYDPTANIGPGDLPEIPINAEQLTTFATDQALGL